MALTVDSLLGPFDENEPDSKKKVSWVPCRICREIFNRIRLTELYCKDCERCFCSEHGTFKSGHGKCVRCYTKATNSELLP